MTRRSVSVLLIGKDLARDRRRFRAIIFEWSDDDIRGKLMDYALIIADQKPQDKRFYRVRIRALGNELLWRDGIRRDGTPISATINRNRPVKEVQR
jgi:hypothetical protein